MDEQSLEYNEWFNLIEETEGMMERLYMLYAAKFPEHSVFWSTLAAEEREHAEEVRRLLKTKPAGRFLDSKIPVNALYSVQHFLQSSIQEAEQGALSYTDALTTALRLERSNIEGKHAEVFSSLDPELRKLFDVLSGDEKHVTILLDELLRVTSEEQSEAARS